MAKSKFVSIGQEPELPTILEFFTEMSERQGEEIRRLKEEQGVPLRTPAKARTLARKSHKRPVPDPWMLHPVRIKKAAKKKSAKKSVKKAAAKKSAPKKAAKKTAKKKSGRRS